MISIILVILGICISVTLVALLVEGFAYLVDCIANFKNKKCKDCDVNYMYNHIEEIVDKVKEEQEKCK